MSAAGALLAGVVAAVLVVAPGAAVDDTDPSGAVDRATVRVVVDVPERSPAPVEPTPAEPTPAEPTPAEPTPGTTPSSPASGPDDAAPGGDTPGVLALTGSSPWFLGGAAGLAMLIVGAALFRRRRA
ncbi:MAG: LPXTG cell wall anchor domain-containing protein [Microbacterium enclense]